MKILVLGGTGVISRAIITEGIKAGHHMIAMNRGRRKVDFEIEPETIHADVRDAEDYRRKTAELDVDAVIDVLAYTREDARRTLDCFGGRTRQWIFTSTSCAYQKPFAKYPVRESEAALWSQPEYSYPINKVAMENELRARMSDTRISIVRPSLTYGEGCANVGVLRQNANIVHRLRQGKPLLLYDDGRTVFTFTFAPDLARGYLSLCGNPAAYGEDFHITSRNTASMEDYYSTFARIIGCEPRFAYLPSRRFFEIDPAQFEHIWYEKRFDHIFSLDKIKRVSPDWEPRISLEQGLRGLVGWWDRQGMPFDPDKDALEDRLCELATAEK